MKIQDRSIKCILRNLYRKNFTQFKFGKYIFMKTICSWFSRRHKSFLRIAVEVDEVYDLLVYLVLGQGGEYVVQVGDSNFFLQN
jgi:hypothetical protein